MGSIIFYGLIALVGLVLLSTMLPARPLQPQIIYVLTERTQVQGEGGGMLALGIFIALIVALWLAAG